MYQKRRRIVAAVIVVFILGFEGLSFAFASTENRIIPMPQGGLFSESFSGDQNFVSCDFAASSKHDIHIYFENRGDAEVHVTLQKRSFFGKWADVSQVDSSDTFFPVKPGDKIYKTYAGMERKTYRIKIDCPSEAGVSGYVHARQL